MGYFRIEDNDHSPDLSWKVGLYIEYSLNNYDVDYKRAPRSRFPIYNQISRLK